MQGPTPSSRQGCTPSPPSLTQETIPICDNPANREPSTTPQTPASSDSVANAAASRLATPAPLPLRSNLRYVQVGSGPPTPSAPQAPFPYFLTPMDVANYVLKNPLPMYCRLANNGNNRNPNNNNGNLTRLTLPSAPSASRQTSPPDRRGFPTKQVTNLGPRGPAPLISATGNRQFMHSPPVPLAWVATSVAPGREWPGLAAQNGWGRNVTPALSSSASRRQLQGGGEVEYLWPDASKGNAHRISGSGRRPNSGPATTLVNNTSSPPAGNGLRERRPIVPSNSASGAGVSEMVERGQNMASLAANIGVDSRVDWVTSAAEVGSVTPRTCNIPEKYFGVSFNAPAGGVVSGSPRTLTPTSNPSEVEANLPAENNDLAGSDLGADVQPADISLSAVKGLRNSPISTPTTVPPPADNIESGHLSCSWPESRVFEESSEPDGDAPTPRPDTRDELADYLSSGNKTEDEIVNTVNSCKVQSSVSCKHELTMIAVHGLNGGEYLETTDEVHSTEEPPPAAPRASRKRKAAESAELRILSYQIEEAPRTRRVRQRNPGRASKVPPAASSQTNAEQPSSQPPSVDHESPPCASTITPDESVPVETSPEFYRERKPSFFGFDAGDPSSSEISALSRIWHKSKWKLLDMHLRHLLGELQDTPPDSLENNVGFPLQRYVCVFGDAPVPGELLRESGLQKVGRQRRILTISSGRHPLQGSSLFGCEKPAFWGHLDDPSGLPGTHRKAGLRTQQSPIPYPRRRSLDCLSSDEIWEARTLDLMLIGSKDDSEFLREFHAAKRIGVVPAESLISRPFFYPTEIYEPAARRLHSPSNPFSRQQAFSGPSSKAPARKPANAPPRKPTCSTNRRKPNQISSRLFTASLDASFASDSATAPLRRSCQRSSGLVDNVLSSDGEGPAFRLSPIWDGSSSSWIVQWDVNGRRLTNSFFADASDTIDQAQKKAEADIFCRSLEFARKAYLKCLRSALHESSVTSYVRSKPCKKTAPSPEPAELPVKGEIEIDQDCIDPSVKDQTPNSNPLEDFESPELPTPSTAPESPPFPQSTGYPETSLTSRSRKRKPSYVSAASKRKSYRNLTDKDVLETVKSEGSALKLMAKGDQTNRVIRTATFTGAVFDSLQEILDWIAVLEKLESLLLKQTTVWKECLGADLNSCGMGEIRWGATLDGNAEEEQAPLSYMTQCWEIQEDLSAVSQALLPETVPVLCQVARSTSDSKKSSSLFEGGLMASKMDSMVDRIGLLGDYLQTLRIRREPKKKRRKAEELRQEVASEPARRRALDLLRSALPRGRERADRKWKRYTVVSRKRAGAEGGGAAARQSGKTASPTILQEVCSSSTTKRATEPPRSPASAVSEPAPKGGEQATSTAWEGSSFPPASAESTESVCNGSGKTLVRKNAGSNIRGPMAGRRLPPEAPLSERYSQQRRGNSPLFLRQQVAARRGSVASHRSGSFRTAMMPRAPSDSPPRRPPPLSSQEEDCKSRVVRNNGGGSRHGESSSSFEEGLRRRVQILSVMGPVLSSSPRRGAEKARFGRAEGNDCVGEMP